MGFMDDFPVSDYQQWLDKVNKELKGDDFSQTLIHHFEDLNILLANWNVGERDGPGLPWDCPGATIDPQPY